MMTLASSAGEASSLLTTLELSFTIVKGLQYRPQVCWFFFLQVPSNTLPHLSSFPLHPVLLLAAKGNLIKGH
jgi:hypothetical protein